MLDPLRTRLSAPFHVEELSRLKPARLVDVGCGNGYMLELATRLGWDATGLELDPAAVASACALGLHVLEGGYERLAEFERGVDCVLCSHVLEHVSDPRELIHLAARALKPGGVLLLALPNATSVLREIYGDNWRGLEAPRHLSIPSSQQLAAMLSEFGFTAAQRLGRGVWTATAAESSRIRRRGPTLNDADHAEANRIVVAPGDRTSARADLSEFVCVWEPSNG